MSIKRHLRFAILACGFLVANALPAAQFESPESPDSVHQKADLPGTAKWNADERQKCELLVKADIQQLGEQNPKTLSDRVALALAKSRTGESLAAENELRAVLAIYQRRQGPDHEETLSCRIALAQLLVSEHRPHEALTEYNAILASRQRMLGRDDIEVARVKSLIANAYVAANDFAGAIPFFQEAEKVLEREAGAEAPETLLNRSGLALALGENQNFQEGEKELKDILAIREKLLGPNDASVLMTCYHLARMFGGDHRLEEAESYAARAEVGLTALFGSADSHTVLATRLHHEIQADIKRLASKETSAAVAR